MNAEFYDALELLQQEKGIPKSYMYEKIKAAIASTIKRDKQIPTDNVEVTFNELKKTVRVYVKKTVVEDVINPTIEMSIEEAQSIKGSYQIGDIVEIDYNPADVGRIAAKVGKNVIIQAINEAVNGSLIQEFERMKGTVISGTVNRIDVRNKSIYLDIMGYELPLNEKDIIPGESFKDGERVKVCIADVRKNSKSQEIVLSRTCPDFLKCLFEIEVPEITDGVVEIKSISREAGSRSKVAVWSNDKNVDAVGSCIGAKQARINAILENLNGERIYLIKYSEDPSEYIVAALSPAEVKMLEIDPEAKTCRVAVAVDQLSLAIGKTGQNVRLAARLTGYKIDIVAE